MMSLNLIGYKVKSCTYALNLHRKQELIINY